MARARDYAAEYQRRQSRARQLGYTSYNHRRRTEEAARLYDDRSARNLISKSKNPPPGMTPAQVRRLWAEGDRALRAKDHEEARRIAKRLGYRQVPKGPPQRVFFYH